MRERSTIPHTKNTRFTLVSNTVPAEGVFHHFPFTTERPSENPAAPLTLVDLPPPPVLR